MIIIIIIVILIIIVIIIIIYICESSMPLSIYVPWNVYCNIWYNICPVDMPPKMMINHEIFFSPSFSASTFLGTELLHVSLGQVLGHFFGARRNEPCRTMGIQWYSTGGILGWLRGQIHLCWWSQNHSKLYRTVSNLRRTPAPSLLWMLTLASWAVLNGRWTPKSDLAWRETELTWWVEMATSEYPKGGIQGHKCDSHGFSSLICLLS